MGASIRTGAADVPGTPSALTAVVVHAAGAVCTRTAHIVLPRRAATATLRVTGLPPALHAHSLRARVTAGPPGARVTDVRLDLAATPHRGDELPHLRLDLEDAQDRVARLEDRVRRLEQEIDEVAALRAEPPQPRRGDPPRWAPVESLLALAGFVDTRLATLHTRLRTARKESAEAAHAADLLADRLATSSTAAPTGRTTPTVSALLTLALGPDGPAEPPAAHGGKAARGDAGDVPDPLAASPDPAAGGRGGPSAAAGTPGRGTSGEAFVAGSMGETDRLPTTARESAEAGSGAPDGGDVLDLEVEYQVPGAMWSPVYRLRLDGRSGDGTLVLRACVAQRTGEDWSGVRLGLSTADLLRRTDLPELRSLRIGRRQEQPPRPGWREPPPGLAELFAGYDAAAASRAAHAPLGAGPERAVSVAVPAAMAPAAAEADDIAYGAAAGAGIEAGAGAAQEAGRGGAPGPVVPGAARASRARMRHAVRGGVPASADAAEAPAAAEEFGALETVPGRGPDPEARAATAPGDDLLDYARLTMAGPDAPHGRGTLRPAEPDEDAVMARYRGLAGSVDGLPRPAHGVAVRRSAGSFDYRFDTAAPVDVEADGAWHTVPVDEIPVSTEFGYVCVPSQDAAVFGTVLLTNSSPHALLAGPVDVLVDGDFVLTASLPTLAPGQRQAVGLGVAESVRVARTTRMRESTAGLRGGTTVLDHSVEIEVANRLPYAVTVEIRERVPVSTDRDVRIEEHKARPPWTAPDQPPPGQEGVYVRGLRVWRVELEPGRTTTLTGGYDIRLPAGKSVVGGNRRN